MVFSCYLRLFDYVLKCSNKGTLFKLVLLVLVQNADVVCGVPDGADRVLRRLAAVVTRRLLGEGNPLHDVRVRGGVPVVEHAANTPQAP